MCRKKKLSWIPGFHRYGGTSPSIFLFLFWGGFCTKEDHYTTTVELAFFFFFASFRFRLCLACKKLKYKRNLSFREAVLYSG